MFQIFLVSHAPFASATLETARQILGDSLPLSALDIGAKEIPDAAQARFNERLDALLVDGEVLILADFLGGTPSNIILPRMGEADVEIITGYNMPLVFKAVSLARGKVALGEVVGGLASYGVKHLQRAADLLAE